MVGIFSREVTFSPFKEFILDQISQRDFFCIKIDENTDKNCYIQGLHDTKHDRIYLNLVCKNGFQTGFESSKMLLFLLHICHQIIVFSPGYNLDLDFVHLFQALEAAR